MFFFNFFSFEKKYHCNNFHNWKSPIQYQLKKLKKKWIHSYNFYLDFQFSYSSIQGQRQGQRAGPQPLQKLIWIAHDFQVFNYHMKNFQISTAYFYKRTLLLKIFVQIPSKGVFIYIPSFEFWRCMHEFESL